MFLTPPIGDPQLTFPSFQKNGENPEIGAGLSPGWTSGRQSVRGGIVAPAASAWKTMTGPATCGTRLVPLPTSRLNRPTISGARAGLDVVPARRASVAVFYGGCLILRP
jgi:hypothetical protein